MTAGSILELSLSFWSRENSRNAPKVAPCDLWYENEFDGRNRQLTVFLEKLTGYEVNLNKINDMINAYLTGVSWIYLYYTQGINYVNINYMYEYFHAPLFSDLSKINYSEISERLGEYEYDDLDSPDESDEFERFADIHGICNQIHWNVLNDNSTVYILTTYIVSDKIVCSLSNIEPYTKYPHVCEYGM